MSSGANGVRCPISSASALATEKCRWVASLIISPRRPVFPIPGSPSMSSTPPRPRSAPPRISPAIRSSASRPRIVATTESLVVSASRGRAAIAPLGVLQLQRDRPRVGAASPVLSRGMTNCPPEVLVNLPHGLTSWCLYCFVISILSWIPRDCDSNPQRCDVSGTCQQLGRQRIVISARRAARAKEPAATRQPGRNPAHYGGG